MQRGPSQPGPPVPVGHNAARLAVSIAVIALYYWIIGIGAEHRRFAWNSGLDAFYANIKGSEAVNGYYDLLGRAFAHGRVRLPVEPNPELLALRDPWLGVENLPYRLLDLALFERRYYLYHGATPVVLLFTPWYVLTRHDFPENFAAFLFASLGFLVTIKLFTECLASLSVRLPVFWYALFLAALGLGQGAPFLLHRAKVYEVAIACGYFCLSCGFLFLQRWLRRPATSWAALSGLAFGLAVGCRPHLVIVAGCVLLFVGAKGILAWGRLARNSIMAFALPLALCGFGIALYNYIRFHNPFEFGTAYLLGDDLYRNFHFSVANLPRGLYYLLLAPPRFAPEFPFIRLPVLDSIPSTTPEHYFLEPTVGVLLLCPIVLLCPLAIVRGRNLSALILMFVSSLGSLILIAAVPFTSQRYDVDFLPSLQFVACVIAAGLVNGAGRPAPKIGIAVALLYCVGAGLTLGVQGPYDQFLQENPSSYVQLASWFSPFEEFRLLLNPPLRLAATFEFPGSCPQEKEPLFSAGEAGSRYLLSVECDETRHIRLQSESSPGHPDGRSVELPDAPQGRHAVMVEFLPQIRTMSVFWDGHLAIRHPLRFLVTSPSQIRCGSDPSLGSQDVFAGRIFSPRLQVFRTKPGQ